MQKKDHRIYKKDAGGSVLPVYRVGVLPVAGFALMSYACTVEPLRAANLLSRKSLYDIIHFAEADRAQSSGSASVERVHEIGANVELDLLLVVAGGDPFGFDDDATFAWLRQLDRRGVRIGGVSGGAVILARAGLLAGRRMTVHWEHAPMLAERFPDLLIERRLYVIDRDRVTCGGGVAPLDLMHTLIAGQHGSAFARLVSDWFLHTDIRAATAPQRGGIAERVGSSSPHVVEAVSAMESHVADPLSLRQLALVAGVTPRHLNRLFAEVLGESAMDYYRGLRLAVGRRLVRSSTMSIGEIAEATGFSSSGHFSNSYKNRFDVRPQTDRRAGRAARV
ncbi:MAG: GlxA family transcriptional regulator [Rhodobacter sp.]|nr:GlxA family transcriptional regulator [Rhodobacter sp.]